MKAAIGSIVAHEGKTAPLVEEELGNLIGVSGASIQRYKAGHIPPEHRAIEILANAAVQRGYLNQVWLRAFLGTTSYPNPELLLNRFYGMANLSSSTQAQANNPIYSNLPAPTYFSFIQREVACNAILEGLEQRCAAVVIVSLGGMGKTSLVREIAARCLAPEAPVNFRAAVWVSDYDRPGTTTLETVLNEIAFTLDYPGLVHFDLPTKQREVERLLRRQKTLLVLDNCETISDNRLLDWVVRMPEPSKVLVTSRQYHTQFRNNSWLVELDGMRRSEAHEFLSSRIQALKLLPFLADLDQLDPVLNATGGNPKALDLALGYLKYSGQTLEQIIHALGSAHGEIFDDLFSRSWEMSDEKVQQVLMAVPLFSGSVAREALICASGIQASHFTGIITRLRELALIETQQTDIHSAPRYTLHPLARSFVMGKLHRQPDFAKESRARQLAWYIELAEKVGYCWDDLARLDQLDPERETLHALINWCLEEQQYAQLFRLVCGVDYYYYIRGLWQGSPGISELRVIAAQKLSDPVETLKALAYHIQMLCRRELLDEAQKNLEQLNLLAADLDLPEALRFNLEYTTGIYLMSRAEYGQAIAIWQKAVELSRELSVRDYAVSRGWLARCFYRYGQESAAAQLWNDILEDAGHTSFKRGVVSSHLGLARVHLDKSEYEQAFEHLSNASHFALSYQDRSAAAEIDYLYAIFYQQTGNLTLAYQHCLQAVDIYKRLGIQKEYDEASRLLVEVKIN